MRASIEFNPRTPMVMGAASLNTLTLKPEPVDGSLCASCGAGNSSLGKEVVSGGWSY